LANLNGSYARPGALEKQDHPIELPRRLRRHCATDGLLFEQPFAFVRPAAHQELEELADVVCGTEQVRRGNDGSSKAVVVRKLDELFDGDAEGLLENILEWPDQTRTRARVDSCVAQTLIGQTVVEVRHTKRRCDFVLKEISDRFARYASNQFRKEKSAGDGMVRGNGAWRIRRFEIVDQLEDGRWVGKQIEVGDLLGRRRNAPAMRQQIANGDRVFAVRAELGNERGKRFIDVEQVPLREEVNEHRSDRLRTRKEIEGCAGRSEDPCHISRVARTVASRVADGAVQDDLSAATDADRKRRMEAGVVERLRRDGTSELHPRLVHANFIANERGQGALARIYQSYIDVARAASLPLLLCAPTWRANRERVSEAGVHPDLNAEAVSFMTALRAAQGPMAHSIKIGGVIGCKNDCYRPEEALSTGDAQEFHAWQVGQLADAAAGAVSELRGTIK